MVEMMSFRTVETRENPDEQGRYCKKPCVGVCQSVSGWQAQTAEIRSAWWEQPLGETPRGPVGSRAQECSMTTFQANVHDDNIRRLGFRCHTSLSPPLYALIRKIFLFLFFQINFFI